MDKNRALAGLSALGQETRLDVFRLLLGHAPDGLPAGEIGARLGVVQNTLSNHLSILQQAGLAAARREGRSILYSADMAGTRALMGFLLEDCCGGRADLCGPVLDEIARDCA